MKRTGLLLWAVAFVALGLVLAAAGCSGGETVDTSDTIAGPSSTTPSTTASEAPTVMTVQEALSAEGPVKVVGAIIVDHGEGAGAAGDNGEGDTTVVLTTALAESYPPQPGGPTMQVTGLDLDALVGLSTTVGEADVVPRTWTNYWVVLEGTVADGVLEVTAMPETIEATTPELRVRFSMPTAPLVSGDSEWWVFDVRNDTTGPLDLTFSSGQELEVVLSQDGVEKYSWSSDLLFTEAIKTVTLAPGETYPIAAYDRLVVPPGQYDLAATVTATVTVDGEQVPIPALESAVQVW